MKQLKCVLGVILFLFVTNINVLVLDASSNSSYIQIGSSSDYSFDTADEIEPDTLYYREFTSDWHSRKSYSIITMEQDGYIMLDTTMKYYYDISIYNEERQCVYALGSVKNFSGYFSLDAGKYYILLNNETFSNNYFYLMYGRIYYEYCEKEPNDTFSDSQQLNFDEKYMVFTGQGGDKDYFSFYAYNNAKVKLIFDNYEIANPHLTLYESNRSTFNYIRPSYDSGLGKYIYEFQPINTGIYYIEGQSYENNEWYILEVQHNSPTILINQFVTRLYQVCLNREPDAAGKADWSGRLQRGEISGIQAAYGFIFSNEFKGKNLCNADYVEQLYNAFMGRGSDAVGKADWVGKLNSGWTREGVFNGFAFSQEFQQLCADYEIRLGQGIGVPTYGTVPTGCCSVCGKEDGVTGFVKRLYSVCLGREADAVGLADWTNKLWNYTASGSGTAYGFVFSDEFISKNHSNEDYVEYLYNAFMGRGSDAIGKADWVSKLNSGWTRYDVFNGFVGSQEFMGICNSYGIVR